ncbi:TetR/AcrR family transcriptional regulator [Roseobacter sinensis]|uniref:TetR/AcrR family transcriptional regulator n=1 Tax=Roseobacter sinensis TaxID=2931391 RepID=A0ABT3BJU3_9RHOB|nr:TetR/AcrR family transcriptional regulator [Roseobacter sp. WL0113]MCV3273853.1 TetR/AcrR family transcriptional regulator [Roseobacter sp. WL0113]
MTDCSAPPASKYDLIFRAAVEEFQENGFADARMDRVSARAEVSKRTVYKYFESKENLFRSIIDAFAARFSGVQDIRYDPARPLREQLVELAWAEGRLLIAADVIAMARMIISETLRNPELAEEANSKIDKTGVFAAMLRAASEDGKMSISDPEDAAVEFIGLIKSKAFWPVIFGAPVVTAAQMDKIVETSVDMMMSRYGTGPS